MKACALASWIVLAGCAEEATTPPAAPKNLAPLVEAPPAAGGWRETTESPQEARAPADARLAELARACRTLDGALMRVAARVAAEPADRDIDVEWVTPLLRENGAPYVRPRVVTGAAIATALTSLRVASTRCGVASAGGRQIAVVADAVADLEPLPVRSRTGAWLDVRGQVHVPARDARVVVLGARGAPRTVSTTFDPTTGRVRARFALDRPGPFVVQVVADLDGGPRPVLEARVFADVAPSHTAAVAPGEDAAGDDAMALERMVAATRSQEALAPLRRDARLDALARAHVERAVAARAVVHDAGDGDLAERFQRDGLRADVIGENVARGASLALAHRALYASPSHRLNLLNAKYTHMGLAVLRDAGGRVYVCEVFSSPPS